MAKVDLSPGLRVVLIGAIANIALSLIKLAGGVFGNSLALVVDAVHSLSDLLTDCVVLFTHQIGRLPKDANHPYGHGRAENIGSTLIGVIILLAGAGLLYESIENLVLKRGRSPEVFALMAALLSILINEGLYHYTKRIGDDLNSPSIVANAWHHRSDAFSSIAAGVGIFLAMQGYPLLDPIAGIVVSVMVLKVGFDVLREGLRDLMDTSLSEEETEAIEGSINATPGVIQSHDIRTRRVGGEVFMDAHILVDREATVTEGHQISEDVRRRLIRERPDLTDVLVHVDTEDDSDLLRIHLIDRDTLKSRILPIMNKANETGEGLVLNRFRVHYHKGNTIVEIFVRTQSQGTQDELQGRFKSLKGSIEALSDVDQARIFWDPVLGGE